MQFSITNSGTGIGDKTCFLSFPENFFLNTGIKLISPQKNEWFFKNNPYIEYGNICEKNIDLWFMEKHDKKINHKLIYKSLAETLCDVFGFKTFLRHPRLYTFENNEKKNYFTIHSTGKSCGGSIPEKVLNTIKTTYKNFKFIQIGGRDDKKVDFAEDMTGLDILESASIISSSSCFFGVNSSMMNIASCYPSVSKKIIITNDFKNDEEILDFIPMKTNSPNSGWLDFSYSVFNNTELDIGATFSYKKI